jgi:septum formation protein
MTSANVHLVLASASPARAKVLKDAGYRFEVQVANSVDEDALIRQMQQEGLHPAAVVEQLAISKAEAVARAMSARPSRTFVIGCDSMFYFDNVLQGKPITPSKALEQILSYRGKSGILYTGHALCQVGNELQIISRTVSTTVHFGSYTTEAAQFYVDSGEPLQVAGSFAIDALGSNFIRSVDGDYHSVVGISPFTVGSMLAEFGIDFTTLLK